MSRGLAAVLLSLGVLGIGNLAWAQESPRAEQRAAQRREAVEAGGDARAVLQITSEEGVCYWNIMGDGDLVRLLVKDEGFSSILLSARFENDQLHLSMAGERTPLDTLSLGQVELGLTDGSPITMDSFRVLKSASKTGWQFRVIPPHTKVDTSNCCSCGVAKLSCCPNKGYCMGCGVCGNCCG